MILYKYYPCNENTYKSLAAHGLWCHYPKNMNDPFECLAQVDRKLDNAKIDAFRAYVTRPDFVVLPTRDSNRIRKLISGNDEVLQTYFNKMRKNFISKWAFCSLSEKYDDILMWSHYTNAHKGFVLGFEFEDFNNRLIFQKVCYRDLLNDFDLIQWADFICEKRNDYMANFLSDISIKSVVWEREKEWRIWRNAPAYYHYKPEELKEVYFGINCDIESKNLVSKLLDLPETFIFYEMEFKDDPIRLVY